MAKQPVGKSVPPGVRLADNIPIEFHDAPTVAASSLQIAGVANDFVLTFTSPRMGRAKVNGVLTEVARISPVTSVLVSALTLKEISLVINERVAKYEEEFGVIETAFTRKRAAKKATESAA